MTAPAVVLAHGRWHGAWCWDAVGGELTGRGGDELMFVAAFPLEGASREAGCDRPAGRALATGRPAPFPDSPEAHRDPEHRLGRHPVHEAGDGGPR